MFAPVLEIAPDFQPIWKEFKEEWSDQKPSELPLYLALGDLANYISTKIAEADETDELYALFSVVERWHIEGDDYVKEAATIGLLEGLQNFTMNNRKARKEVENRLLPESKRWWDKVEEFWKTVP